MQRIEPVITPQSFSEFVCEIIFENYHELNDKGIQIPKNLRTH